jgi:anti-sigma regulatory factor (Ser/Thr protein kinase)
MSITTDTPACLSDDPMSGEWSLETFLELGPYPTAVACARWHARQVLWEWGLTRFSDRVELVVSELMTNAIQASSSPDWIFPVRMWLRADNSRVLILVWDINPRPPKRADASEDSEAGRGLMLVESLSARWDWYQHKELGGKVVWCLIGEPGD